MNAAEMYCRKMMTDLSTLGYPLLYRGQFVDVLESHILRFTNTRRTGLP